MRLLLATVLSCALTAAAAAQTISLPEGQEFTGPDRYPFALSPDGSRLVYNARATLFVKRLPGGEPTVLEGPLQGRTKTNPAFSADGQSIVYWSGDGSVLERVPAGGGAKVTLGKVENPLGLSWGADGQVYIGAGAAGVLRTSSNGGPVQTAVKLGAGEAARSPQLLPDGDYVLFTLGEGTPTNWTQSRIVAQSMKTGQRTVITSGGDARYLQSGQLVYVAGNRLMAVTFDARSRSMSGQPVAIAEGVQTANTTGAAQLAVASNGAVAFVRTGAAPTTQMALVGMDGKRTPLGAVPPGTSAPRVSANGKKIAFAAQGTIYVADFPNVAGARKVIENATFPLPSPDGEWLAFGALGTQRDNGEEVVFMQRADGSGMPVVVAKPARAPEHWGEGEQGFSFITHRGMANNYDVWFYSPARKEVEPIAVSVDESGQLSSSTSPNQKWVAYISSESGEWQIYIQPYPANGKKFQVTKAGGRSPMWTSDNQLVFDSDGQMYSVSIQFGDTPTFSAPKLLPITGYIQPLLRRNWELVRAGDASQFIMLFRPGPQIDLLTNWKDRLQPRTARN